jgi:peptidoglycan hydrolase CwlO-like protein
MQSRVAEVFCLELRMLKPLELRVSDMEDLIADIPHLVNLRLEGVMSSLHETNSRIALIDRQFSGFVRDLRDLRGGVTRQLMAQDVEIAEIKAKVIGLETDMSAMKADITGMKTDITGMKSDIAGMKSDIAKINVALSQILSRLPKV